MLILLLIGNLIIGDLPVKEDVEDFEWNMQRGLRQYLDKQWKPSIEFLKLALKKRPENPFALYLIACAEANLKSNQEAAYYIYLLSKQNNTASRQILYSIFWDPAFEKVKKKGYVKRQFKNIKDIYGKQVPLKKEIEEAKKHFEKGLQALKHIEYDQALMYFRFSYGYWRFFEAGYYYTAVCYARQGFVHRAVNSLKQLRALRTGLSMHFLAMLPKDRNFNDIREHSKFKQFQKSLSFFD